HAPSAGRNHFGHPLASCAAAVVGSVADAAEDAAGAGAAEAGAAGGTAWFGADFDAAWCCISRPRGTAPFVEDFLTSGGDAGASNEGKSKLGIAAGAAAVDADGGLPDVGVGRGASTTFCPPAACSAGACAGGSTSTMLPHLGQASIWPIASGLVTRKLRRHVVHCIENGCTRLLASIWTD